MWAILITVILAIIIIIIVSVVLNNKKCKFWIFLSLPSNIFPLWPLFHSYFFLLTSLNKISVIFIFLKNIEEN